MALQHDPECPFRWIFETSRDLILVVRKEDGRILDANPAAVGAYGYPRHELLEKRIFDLRAESIGELAPQMFLSDQTGILFEAMHRRKDGSTFPVEVSTGEATISGAHVLISIARDIPSSEADRKPRAKLSCATEPFSRTRASALARPARMDGWSRLTSDCARFWGAPRTTLSGRSGAISFTRMTAPGPSGCTRTCGAAGSTASRMSSGMCIPTGDRSGHASLQHAGESR